jgi:septum site-determining protein MinC
MNAETASLEFKSATLYTIRAVLRSGDTAAIIASLEQRMREAGGFFSGEAVVIDATETDQNLDWAALLEAFSEHQLPVIGVVAQGHILEQAQQQGLAQVELSNNTPRSTTAPQAAADVSEPVQAPTPVPATNTQAAEPASTVATGALASSTTPTPTLVIQGPLRSGQRVYARHTDLIVMGVVSQGAEVIADGNIHVYGPLRGKAMAGARGDTQARIFTTALDAELVAVAGVYRVIDTTLSANLHRKPAMVYLKDQALRLEPLAD